MRKKLEIIVNIVWNVGWIKFCLLIWFYEYKLCGVVKSWLYEIVVLLLIK